ncbi:MAG: DUF3783 domain-containing protein [Desulfobacteraceae bacterium]|jgi:hypothetical protein|nr:DUF3783 domain-containing protein [Desulfobacteraceae bacterium]
MADAKFQKVARGERPLYGPRKMLLCGFPAGAQTKFESLMEMLGLSSVPRVWVTDDQRDAHLAELFSLAPDTGKGSTSTLPRAVIVGGVTEAQLHRLMGGCKKAGMQQALWAVLTPTSEQWTLEALLSELAAERAAMQQRRR